MSPTVLRQNGYQFIIFTSDHPPPHVHVRREGKLAKIQLDPIQVVRHGAFNDGEINKILEIVKENLEFLLNQWSLIYGNQ